MLGVIKCSLHVMAKAKSGGSKKLVTGPKHIVNSDGSRVLDRGVYKRFKYCISCNLIIVERSKWANCWNDVKYCSDKCRKAGKANSKPRKAGEESNANESLQTDVDTI